MSPEASSSRHAFPSRQPSWAERKFLDSEDAKAALCSDRPAFIIRHDILKHIPGKIKRCITYPGAVANIEGFQELFIYLNKTPGQKVLRQLVESYFASSPSLRGHLSQ